MRSRLDKAVGLTSVDDFKALGDSPTSGFGRSQTERGMALLFYQSRHDHRDSELARYVDEWG